MGKKVRNTREGSGSGVRMWCLMRQDDTLRTVISMKLKQVNAAALCRELEIDRMNMEHWRTGRQPKAITQYDLWRLAKKLGVTITGVKMEFSDE
jgi:hypothetical protein